MLLIAHINRNDSETLGPQFLRLLWDAGSVQRRIVCLFDIGNRFLLLLPLFLAIVLSSWTTSSCWQFFCEFRARRGANTGQRADHWYLAVCFAVGWTTLTAIGLSSLCVMSLWMGFMFWVFQVRCIMPSDLLGISQLGKLIFVVCVQFLSQKDREALPNYLWFDIGVNIPCNFTVTRNLLCLSIFVTHLEGKNPHFHYLHWWKFHVLAWTCCNKDTIPWIWIWTQRKSMFSHKYGREN